MSLTEPAGQTKHHSWSALAMSKYGLVLLSCYYGSVFLSLPDPSAGSPTCPHNLVPNTGWTGGQFDASRNDKSRFDLWLNYSKKKKKKKLHRIYIRGGSDKEQAGRLHAGQINLQRWKKSAFLFPLCTI